LVPDPQSLGSEKFPERFPCGFNQFPKDHKVTTKP
jgi:hypothetical protein